MQIQSADWNLPPLFTDSVQTCEQGHEARVVKFGVVHWNHDGFPDGHGPVDDEQPGRAYIRPNRANQLVFFWEIAGWEYVESAEIWVFAYRQDRPIAFETVSAASGTIETWATTAGVRLTSGQLQIIPNDVYTIGGGPYLARIRIAKVKANTKVTVRALRTYFEVLPMAVIGGGFAGIRAAATLLEKGNNESVLLLEALDRMGGRACTMEWGNLQIDLGCQFLQDASTNPLVTLAGELRQEVFWHDQTEVILWRGKNVRGREEWKAADGIATDTESFEDDISLMEAARRVAAKKAQEHVFDARDKEGNAAAREAKVDKDDYQATYEFGRNWAVKKYPAEVEKKEREMMENLFLRLSLALLADLDEAIEPDKCTKLEEEEDEGNESDEEDSEEVQSDGRNKMAVAGFGALLQAYAEQTFRRAQGYCSVRMGIALQRLEHTERYIRIVTSKGNFYAAGVIVSISTEIIRGGHIAFQPPLSQDLQSAFGCLPLGHYKKIFLPVRPDSPLDKYLRSYSGKEAKKQEAEPAQRDLSFMTLDRDGLPWKFLFRLSLDVIVAFVGGEFARKLDAGSNEGAAEAALKALVDMTLLSPEEVHQSWTGETTASRWSQEPFFRGAYSYTSPGGVTAKARSKLRDAVVNTRIVFAGEAMRLAKHEFATAHGAWLSGEYAAMKLLGLGL